MQITERLAYLLTALICFKLTTIVWRKVKQRFKEKNRKKGFLWGILAFLLISMTFESVASVIVPPKDDAANIETTTDTSTKESTHKSETTSSSTEATTSKTEKENPPKEHKKTAVVKKEKKVDKSNAQHHKKQPQEQKKEKEQSSQPQKPKKLTTLPNFNGQPYVAVNNNRPIFESKDKTTQSFERYSPLDSLGRVGVAYANLSTSTMGTEKRGAIGHIKPTGWHTVRYSNVDGKYLYNRCHLIGYQLSAENDNERNLMTGTRYLNVDGMLPFENMVADYIKETNHHVLYRVTPYFEGEELVARGVQIEAESVEDKGKGISFNVYCFNNQPGVKIQYATGNSELTDPNAHVFSSRTQSSSHESYTNSAVTKKESTPPSSASSVENATGEIRGNKESKIYHCPGQRDYENMADSKNLVIFSSPKEAEAAGYRIAKR